MLFYRHIIRNLFFVCCLSCLCFFVFVCCWLLFLGVVLFVCLLFCGCVFVFWLVLFFVVVFVAAVGAVVVVVIWC